MNKSMVVAVMAVCAVAGTFATSASAAEYLSGIKWAMPAIVDTGPGSPTSAAAPSDAVVLFDGTDMSKWEGADNWVVQDGCVIAGPGEVKSKEVFGDCQVHIEWSSDEKAEGSGQGRSNSGVFLMDVYEIQVLDSYNNETYFDGQCGAIYKQHPPLANATRPPGQWQTYDIIWTSPASPTASWSVLHSSPCCTTACSCRTTSNSRVTRPTIERPSTNRTRTRGPSGSNTTATLSGSATSGCAKPRNSNANACTSRRSDDRRPQEGSSIFFAATQPHGKVGQVNHERPGIRRRSFAGADG